MTQAQTPTPRSLSFVVAFIGALVGAAFFGVMTMDVAVAIILGAPIGLMVGVIGARALPRIMHRSASPSAQLNGAAPAPPTVEEQVKPAFRMKIKN